MDLMCSLWRLNENEERNLRSCSRTYMCSPFFVNFVRPFLIGKWLELAWILPCNIFVASFFKKNKTRLDKIKSFVQKMIIE